METNAMPQAFATIDEVRALLQAAQFATIRLKQQAQSREVMGLSEAINKARVPADGVRVRIRTKLSGKADNSSEPQRRCWRGNPQPVLKRR